jgi:tRNA (guanine37-N1)-methyltransferase
MPRLIRKVAEGLGTSVADLQKVETGIDAIGDIAILRLPDVELPLKERIAEALLDNVSNLKCVFEQEGGIEGEFRLRKLHHLAGENRTETTHRENGCAYRVDVASCYFSPRLSTERMRIAEEVGGKEHVLNMFAGVGPFSILIARKCRARVVSCELNQKACEYHVENNKINHVERLVKVINADAADLPGLVGDEKFDRILMPLPSRASEFLPEALTLAAPGCTIHYYRQVLGRNQAEATLALKKELAGLLPPGSASFDVRRVREVGPRWLELAADILA